jgi:hypothetical protein
MLRARICRRRPERRAFKLLPLVWIVVLVLAAIILYTVFK